MPLFKKQICFYKILFLKGDTGKDAVNLDDQVLLFSWAEAFVPLGPACWLQLSSLCSWPDTSSVTYKSTFDNSLFSLEHTAPQFQWPKPCTLFLGFLTVQPTVETWSVMQANLILASMAAQPVIKSSQTQMTAIK